MSANLIVDLGNNAVSLPSITTPPLSGVQGALSGALVGAIADMLNADTFTNMNLAGLPSFTSGELRVGVQTSDGTTSGGFTDPTSGLAQFPTVFASGGIIYLNSGGAASGGYFGAGVSGQYIQSGFNVFAGFQRPHRYTRAIMFGSGSYAGSIQVNFVGQQKVTGSGGGFTLSPGSGSVNV